MRGSPCGVPTAASPRTTSPKATLLAAPPCPATPPKPKPNPTVVLRGLRSSLGRVSPGRTTAPDAPCVRAGTGSGSGAQPAAGTRRAAAARSRKPSRGHGAGEERLALAAELHPAPLEEELVRALPGRQLGLLPRRDAARHGRPHPRQVQLPGREDWPRVPRRAAPRGEEPRVPADRGAARRLQDHAVRRERGRRRRLEDGRAGGEIHPGARLRPLRRRLLPDGAHRLPPDRLHQLRPLRPPVRSPRGDPRHRAGGPLPRLRGPDGLGAAGGGRHRRRPGLLHVDALLVLAPHTHTHTPQDAAPSLPHPARSRLLHPRTRTRLQGPEILSQDPKLPPARHHHHHPPPAPLTTPKPPGAGSKTLGLGTVGGVLPPPASSRR